MKTLYAQRLSELKKKLGNTQLLIVSKTRSVDDIKSYYDLGHYDFGENRVQELLEKSTLLKKDCPKIRWHMIGHLQSNKLNSLFKVPGLFAIHSVDSMELLKKIWSLDVLPQKIDQKMNIFLQVNTSGEEQKFGFTKREEILEAAQVMTEHKIFEWAGLMTMGTLRTENFLEEAARCFKELQDLKNCLDQKFQTHLQTSMGMSQDYEIALSFHSSWVRLGSMMFG